MRQYMRYSSFFFFFGNFVELTSHTTATKKPLLVYWNGGFKVHIKLIWLLTLLEFVQPQIGWL